MSIDIVHDVGGLCWKVVRSNKRIFSKWMQGCKFEWSNQNVYHLMLARREYQQDRDWAGENFKIKIPLKQNK